VQIDGEPVRSCLLPVGSMVDRKIATIEGIGPLVLLVRRALRWLRRESEH
jgi:aerobic-type carbon monoxide dehydrogenase small subunit (CoxS/CutS family)